MLSKRKYLFGTTILAGVIAAAAPAFAQEAVNTQDPGDAAQLDEVVVTGSRIRRVDPTNAPQPIIQIGREQILESGQPNLVDYLADVPACKARRSRKTPPAPC